MDNSNKAYAMPPLTDNLIKKIIFSMDNQKSTGYLDLFSNNLIEVEDIEREVQVPSEENPGHYVKFVLNTIPQRFLMVPEWGPLQGFKMREEFVNDLKNPLYAEKLNKVLHTGRGVFRKFKEVLHSNQAIERQWYLYKATYMKEIVIKWYEYNNGAINLDKLPLDIEELPDDLLLEDFDFKLYKNDEKKEEIDKLSKKLIDDLSDVEKILLNNHLSAHKNTEHLCILTSENILVGFIEYKKKSSEIAEIISYGVSEEYRGIGLFNMALDKLIRQLNREDCKIILSFYTTKYINMSKKLKNIDYSCNLMYLSIDIETWIYQNPSSELLEV